jgi:hypothetical protein
MPTRPASSRSNPRATFEVQAGQPVSRRQLRGCDHADDGVIIIPLQLSRVVRDNGYSPEFAARIAGTSALSAGNALATAPPPTTTASTFSYRTSASTASSAGRSPWTSWSVAPRMFGRYTPPPTRLAAGITTVRVTPPARCRAPQASAQCRNSHSSASSVQEASITCFLSACSNACAVPDLAASASARRRPIDAVRFVPSCVWSQRTGVASG